MTSRSRGLIAAVLLTGALATLPACNDNESSASDSSNSASDSKGSDSKGSSGSDSSAGKGDSGSTGGETSGGSSGGDDSCRKLVASAEVKKAVTDAYRQAFPVFKHIQPTPGSFYYGECGNEFAGTTFEVTPGHSEKEGVAMQDEGATMKYFTIQDGEWMFIASGALEQATGCTTVKEIPKELAKAWNDCK
ncbi:hypothetical protein [Streptomyces sp. NPDC047108]|uniref:hypothetical protein n=1 Tax=Streptomyces sp. NPDC047108 TaxID=3155025 RepID=UPI0033EBA665